MGLFDDTSGIDWGVLSSGMATPAATSLPLSPELIAKNAAARGIIPPPVDVAPSAPSDVGAALTGNTVPLPVSRPNTDVSASAKAPNAPLDITSDAQKAAPTVPGTVDKKLGDLATALRGVQAPKSPELQKISSPKAPSPSTAIKGGELVALLNSLNAAPGASGIKLPSTLSQAIGR